MDLILKKTNPAILKSALMDVAALAFIFLVPTFSHLFAFPLYFIEPMRIMVILAMVHTHRNNAFILAFSLPLFSFLVSGHPILIKAFIISIELIIMVGAFFLLKKYIHNFAAIFSAIVISKLAYFALKYFAPLQALNYNSFFEFSLWIQLATTLVLSTYLYLMLKRTK
jgi:hypothetical protein